MPLVEIRLNSFVYRFRRLTWREEAGIKPKKGEDARDLLLALALHDISGLKVSSLAEAKETLRRIPRALRWRIWVVYRGNQPEDRYFSTRGLYEAPEHAAYNKRLIDEGQAEESTDDALERRFGAAEAHEARELESKMLANAIKDRQERKTG